MNSNRPSLKARMLIRVALEDLERNPLFSEALSKTEPTEACSYNKDMHCDQCRVELRQVLSSITSTIQQIR